MILKRIVMCVRKQCAYNWGRWLGKMWERHKLNSRVRFSVQTETRRRWYKDSAREKPAHGRKRSRNFDQCKLQASVQLVQILCTYIFYCSVHIVSLLWITINSFYLLNILIEFTGYCQKVASLPNKIRRLYRHVRKRCRWRTFLRRPLSRWFLLLQLFCNKKKQTFETIA